MGVPITPSNDSVAIVLFYQDKIKYYVTRLKGTNLNPQDGLFAYDRYWLPVLEFAAPVLTIPHSGSLLNPLHKALLQKLKVMRSAPADIGGLYLNFIKIICEAQAIHHLVSLFTSYTPSKLLLITAIEYHTLEIGVYILFLSISHDML